ncbi:MAG: molybdopterin-dependent oxidoreductase [Enterobacterales bacterium]|nr:molybdopterin-dependent oxidoreductase [Enterobacterales bacterium]
MRRLKESDSNKPADKCPQGQVGHSRKHESAEQHVTGEAHYTDDRVISTNLLFAAVGQSPVAHAKIKSIDLSAVRQAAGVKAVITVDDVPGDIDIGPVFPGDLVLAKDNLEYVGQPIFAVAATSQELAKKATRLVVIEYQELPPVLSITDALEQQSFVRPSYVMQRGDSQQGLEQAKNKLKGQIKIGGQEHFYLEGQVAIAEPLENDEFLIYSSTQHPSEVQKLVAEVLHVSLNKVTVETRRMGGAFWW